MKELESEYPSKNTRHRALGRGKKGVSIRTEFYGNCQKFLVPNIRNYVEPILKKPLIQPTEMPLIRHTKIC